MTALENFISPALTRAVGWTLLHSLWQGALVAAVLAGALLLLRRQRAEVRYVASAGALGAVVALAGITFGLYFTAGTGSSAPLLPVPAVKSVRVVPLPQAESPAVMATGASATARVTAIFKAETTQPSAAELPAGPVAAGAQPAGPNWLATGLRYFDKHLPLLVVGWLLGLLAMSLRLLGGLLYVQRLRRYRVRPLGAAWQARLETLAARSGVRRPVALLESALVQVPLVVGHVRPVILLPLGVVAGLSPACLEAILAHELAHVLRRDYLVNLLQTVAESLFFYHPAVWFVANCVRTERENCCDDTATALVGGDPLRLARALTALAEWSQSAVVPAAPRLALAAMSGRGALLSRVRRLVQRRPAAPTLAEGLMAGALVLGGLGLLGGSVAWAGPLAQPATADKPAAFDWQMSGLPNGQAPGVTDTSKRKTGATVSAAGLAPVSALEEVLVPVLAPEALAPRGEQGPELVPDAADAEAAADVAASPADTIIVRRQKGRARGSRARNDRRVVVNGRAGASVFRSNPGTVVITKDKKGRLTDLVVNGQRVDTEAGKQKIKIKDKKGQDQQVEIIRVLPRNGADVQGFVYRSDDGTAKLFEREFQRAAPYTRPAPYIRAAPYTRAAPYSFEFRTPEFSRQLGQTFNKSFRLSPQYRLSPNGTFITPIMPGFGPDPTASVRSQREALRTAERALREANSVKNLSAEQRKRLNQRLKEVQAQLRKLDTASSASGLRLRGADGAEINEEIRDGITEEIRERQEELRDREQELRDRRQELQERIRESQQEMRDLEQSRTDQDRDRRQAEFDRAQASRDRDLAERDRARAERDRERAERDRERAERDRKQTEALMAELVKDGLVKDKGNYQVKLSATSLVVDGKTQPTAVFQKYLKLYESTTGRKMSATGSWVMSRNSNSNTNISSGFGDAPLPPRPPRAPRAPRGLSAPLAPLPPSASQLPAPPSPPRAPSVDTRALRDELRKDGLIGAADKSFQVQLNDSGFTVNGKRQPEETAAKYRKLMGHDRPGQSHSMNISLDD